MQPQATSVQSTTDSSNFGPLPLNPALSYQIVERTEKRKTKHGLLIPVGKRCPWAHAAGLAAAPAN